MEDLKKAVAALVSIAASLILIAESLKNAALGNAAPAGPGKPAVAKDPKPETKVDDDPLGLGTGAPADDDPLGLGGTAAAPAKVWKQDEIMEFTRAAATTKGRDAIAKLLKSKFKVTGGMGDLKETDFAKFVEAVNALADGGK